MPFYFDAEESDTVAGLAKVHIVIARVASGVWDAQRGMTAAERSSIVPADSKAEGWRYSNEEDFRDYYGDGNTDRWIREAKANSHKGPSASALLAKKDIEERGKKCCESLKSIRAKFHPDLAVADVQDGPPEYAQAVNDCILKHFPPPLTSYTYVNLLASALRYLPKLIHLDHGVLSTVDRRELSQRVDFYSYYLDKLNISNVPTPPDKGRRTPHVVRNYVRDVRDRLTLIAIEQRKRTERTNKPTFANGSMGSNWKTITEAALAIDLSKSAITKACNDGRVACEGNGRSRRVDMNSLAEYKIQLNNDDS